MGFANWFRAAMAAALVCCAPLAGAAPAVIYSLRVQTDWGQAIDPVSPGVWNVPCGHNFGVILSAKVVDPNRFDWPVPPYLEGREMGIATFQFDLCTSASGVLEPVIARPADPPWPARWRFNDRTELGISAPFINLLDLDQDGDLDVAGVGMATGLIELPSESQLPLVEVGLRPDTEDLLSGQFHASSVGSTLLSTVQGRTMVFARRKESSAPLTWVDVPVVDASIRINVVRHEGGWDGIQQVPVPEPGLAVGGVGLAVLALRRRRRTCR